MKRLCASLGVLILTAVVTLGVFQIAAQDLKTRLQDKAARAQAGVISWSAEGRDASPVIAVMNQVKPALDAGDPHHAEALLARALEMLSGAAKPSGQSVSSAQDPESDLYIRPEPVSIDGYGGSAMEPFLSPDGRFLFFNNENDPGVNTNLHFAERTGRISFRYIGDLPGVNSDVLDAAASLDRAGHFYFTTVRDYARTMNSVYTGDFDGKAVRNLHPAPGEISPKSPGAINMDVGISQDGETLYISRAVIVTGAQAPKKSELLVARLNNGQFRIDPESERIMRNINTGGLEYAPAISADGRELYFTRASPFPRIMVATRTSVSQPFGEPLALSALTGFVEAPTISLDTQEMFFHKKVSQRFAIYRAERNPLSGRENPRLLP